MRSGDGLAKLLKRERGFAARNVPISHRLLYQRIEGRFP